MNQCTCGRPHHHRKARIRKKRRIGEFAEMGFNVECELADWRTGEENEGTLDGFLQLIESRGLHCGGGCGGHWNLFVCANGRRSATDDDRAIVASFLATTPGVSNVKIGPLEDAWHLPSARAPH